MFCRLAILLALLQTLVAKPYQRLYYDDMIKKVKELVAANPDIFEYFDTYKRYPGVLPTSKCGDRELELPLIRVTNFLKSRDAIVKLPQVFLIGPLHGDEIIGTQVLPRYMEWIVKYKHSKFWHMLNTRLLLIMPSTNPEGYCEIRREWTFREELIFQIDPNRDFPYHVGNNSCMITPSARSINEVVREHLVVSALVFHGGDNSITYPWGNYPHIDDVAPDATAFEEVARLLREKASSYSPAGVNTYNIGTMTKVVYPVDGGLEDWIYGASWDNRTLIPQCTPRSKPEYPPEKTTPLPETNRAFMYLVEAGELKIPDERTFGDDANWDHKGHVSRNLLVVDTLSQITQPEIILESWTAELTQGWRKAEVTFRVQGCIKIEFVKVSYRPHMLAPSDNSIRWESTEASCSNIDQICKASFNITRNLNSGLDFRITPKCDQSWNSKGQSHVSRLRMFDTYNVSNNGFSISNSNQFSHTAHIMYPDDEYFFLPLNSSHSVAFRRGLLLQLTNQPSQVLDLFPATQRPNPVRQLEGVIGVTGWMKKCVGEDNSSLTADNSALFVNLELKLASAVPSNVHFESLELTLTRNHGLPQQKLVFTAAHAESRVYSAQVQAALLIELSGSIGLLSPTDDLGWKWAGSIQFDNFQPDLAETSRVITDLFSYKLEFDISLPKCQTITVVVDSRTVDVVDYLMTKCTELPTQITLYDGRKAVHQLSSEGATFLDSAGISITAGSVVSLEVQYPQDTFTVRGLLQLTRASLDPQPDLPNETPVHVLPGTGTSRLVTVLLWVLLIGVTALVVWCVLYVRNYRREHFGVKETTELAVDHAYKTDPHESASFDV